jgi:predicted phosphodiesterase
MKLTPERAHQLHAEHKSIRGAAVAAGVSKSHFHRVLNQYTANDPGHTIQSAGDDSLEITGSRVRTLDELITSCGINPDEWQVSKWVANKWESYAGTGDDGEPRTVDLYQIKAWLDRLPDWYRVEIGPIEAVKREQRPARQSPVETILTIPDTQIGFRRQPDGTLKPMHDRKAISAAIQLAELVQPDVIVALGDMLDFAAFGRFTVGPDLRFTSMPSLVELHAMYADLREACPAAQIVALEGNHEARLQKTLTDLASGEYLDLRPVDQLDGPPSMSVDSLLALDKLDVEFVRGYGSPWFHSGIMFHHGHIVRARGGKTVSAVLGNASCSQVFGHIHRLEYAERRILDGATGKPKRIFAFSPGALTDHEEVPHAGGSPVLDWQQGVGLIYTDGENAHCHPIPIHEGRLYHDGFLIEGSAGVPARLQGLGIPF